jgi:hypothetical protein
VYPTVSVATLRSFNCRNLGANGNRLTADFRELCPYNFSETAGFLEIMSSKNFIFSWACFCTLVYPVGVPFFFIAVMRMYKIPQIAENKLNAARVDAMVVSYKKKATPVEIEVLIRQLRVHETVVNGQGLLNQRIDALFQALALHGDKGETESLGIQNFLNFFTRNADQLGIPNPDSQVLFDLIEAKDTSGDGTIDQREFSEMMHQMITIQNLFTGHETLDDMHYEQLSRLYEFHKSGIMYLENALNKKVADEESFVQKIIKAVLQKFRGGSVQPAGSKTKNRMQEILSRIQDSSLQAVPQVDYLGIEAMLHLRKYPGVSKETYSKLQLAMVSDLRKRILVLANEKSLDGTIAIPTVLWVTGSDESDSNQDHVDKQKQEERRVLKRVGFLTKNYKVQYWYFELLEMCRKLIMTSIVTFIYTGTPPQIATALVTTLAFCLYTQRAKPFADDKIGDMQVFSLVVQSFTLIYALILTIDELTTLLGLKQSFTQTTVRNMMGAFVVFLNSAIVAFPWIQKAFKLLSTYLERRKRAKSIFRKEIDSGAQAGYRRDAAKWNNAVLDSLLAASMASKFAQPECNSLLAESKFQEAAEGEVLHPTSDWLKNREGDSQGCPVSDEIQEISCEADSPASCKAASEVPQAVGGTGSCVQESCSLSVRNNAVLTEAGIPGSVEEVTCAVAREETRDAAVEKDASFVNQEGNWGAAKQEGSAAP